MSLIDISLIITAFSAVVMTFRVIFTQDSVSRILSFDVVTNIVICILLIYQIKLNSSYLIDMIILFVLISFASTLFFANLISIKLKKHHENPNR